MTRSPFGLITPVAALMLLAAEPSLAQAVPQLTVAIPSYDAGLNVEITAFGFNFTTNSVLAFAPGFFDTAVPVATTYITASELRATIPAGLYRNCSRCFVNVRNGPSCPGNCSEAFTIWMTGLRSISPERIGTRSPGGSPVDLSLSIQLPIQLPAQVFWHSPGAFPVQLEVLSRTSSNLVARIPASLLTTPLTAHVTVLSPPRPDQFTLNTNTLPFTVFADTPQPQLTSISPTQGPVGTSVTLTALGSNFTTSSLVIWRRDNRDTPLATTYVSATQLRATIPASLPATAGPVEILVQNGTSCPGGCPRSNSRVFTVGAGVRIVSMSPNSNSTRAAGSAPIDILVSGQGFAPNAQVFWEPPGGSPIQLELVSRTGSDLLARIPSSLLTTPLIANVTVRNPATADTPVTISNAVPFTVFVVLTLDSLSPASTPAGSPDTQISAIGSGFTSASRVSLRGGGLQFTPSQTVVSPSRIDMTLRAMFLAAQRSYEVFVANDEIQSNTVEFNVTAGVSLTGLSPSSRDAGSGPFQLIVAGTGFTAGSQVVFGTTTLTPASTTTTEIRVNVPANLLTAAANLTVQVRSGGITSTALNFQVIAGRSCVNFPVGFVPFASVYSVSQSNAAGDRLLVGRLASAATLRDIDARIPLPGSANQKFCGQVQLAPGQLVEAYVPAAAERRGDFSGFTGLLLDPLTQGAFPGGIIPVSRLGDPYAWRVTITNAAATPGLLLSQRGFTFQTVQGGPAPSSRSFRVLSGGDAFSFTTAATTLSGGNWLVVSPASGSTSGANTVQVQVNPAGLLPSDYYGEVRVTAPGAPNSPQTVAVVLNVVARNVTLAPAVEPTGMVFATSPGVNARPQPITLTNLTASPLTYSTLATFPGAAWFPQPGGGTVSPTQPVTVAINPNSSTLATGVYPGTLQFSFSDGSRIPVALVLVVAPGAGSGFTAARQAGRSARSRN